jgi:cupin fold WbuC family metalloprotein
MIIAFTKDSYVRPSKHLDKEESIHVLEGEGSFVFFDETGEITFVVPVGGETSGRQMYVRTPKSTYHTLLIKSDRFIVHETTQGPFKREDTVFAKWAPEDGASIEVEKYLKELADRVEKFRISK